VAYNRTDPFLRVSWWMHRRIVGNPRHAGYLRGPARAECRRLMRDGYAILSDTAVFAAGMCEPAARRLALRFAPHTRFWLYSQLVGAPGPYLAQTWGTHPGVALLAYALHENASEPGDAWDLLLRDVHRGRSLRHALGAALERWFSVATAEYDPDAEVDAPWMRMRQASGAQRSRLLADQRLTVMRAGPQVPTMKIWQPPPLGFVPEDIPKAVRANAAWFRAAKSHAAMLGRVREISPGDGRRLARFASKHAAELAAAARARGLRVSHMTGEIVDYCRAEGRYPDRASSAEKILTASSRWHREVAVAEDLARTLGWNELWGDQPALDTPLLPPPWSGKDGASAPPGLVVEQIADLRGLVDEGRRMQHCVASRAGSAMEGGSWFFSARFKGEPLTIEVRGSPGRWRVAELRRFANGRPSNAEHRAVSAWLASNTVDSAAAQWGRQ